MASYAPLSQKGFLLKFGKDRLRWMQWLYQAKKRHGLVVLNYVVTSNHAVGSRSYVEAVRYQMGGSVVGRKVRKHSEGFEPRENRSSYNAIFDTENEDIGGENKLLWYP